MSEYAGESHAGIIPHYGPAPEDEPDDSESQGEGESDDPQGMSRDPAAVGERLRDIAEREAQEAESESGDEPPPAQYDPRTRTCPICKGWGRLLTGSLITGHDERTCWNCAGTGYEEAVRSAPGSPTVYPAVADTPADNPSGWNWPSQVSS